MSGGSERWLAFARQDSRIMETLKLTTTIDSDGHLRLDVPTNLPAGKIDLVIVLSKPRQTHYDFSDLVGKLTWKGDALATQRMLCDEW